MSLIQSLRQFANSKGFDFRRIGKERLGRMLEIDLKSIVAPGATIIDVGANTGRAARLFTGLFPGASILSFEPCKNTYDELSRADDLSHVRKFHCAVGAADTSATLNKFEGSELNSLLSRTTNADHFIDPDSIRKTGTEEVQVKRLDTVMSELEIEEVSLLKIDTQGFDLEVLKGASALLSAGRIGVIQIEVNFSPLYENQPTFSDILNFLSPYGYGLIGLYDESRDSDGRMKWCDALFKRSGE